MWWFWFICLVPAGFARERFTESLFIRPLNDGRVASTFEFVVQLESSPRHPSTLRLDDESQHYSLFPLSLGQIIRAYAVTELHLSLNAGQWNYDTWGYPKESSVAPGAELWAWMLEGADVVAEHRWRDLNNALAGLFCASLSSLDDKRTTEPKGVVYLPEGLLPHYQDEEHAYRLQHAFLPSEHVCTENLTPFLKLLPCKGRSGLASLLNPHKLFDADWHGLSIHVQWNGETGIELKLTVQSVANPLRTSSGGRDWSFQTLFDRSIKNTCPMSHSSEVLVELPHEPHKLSPEPSRQENGFSRFHLDGPLDLNMAYSEPFSYPSLYTPATPLSIRRVLHGTTQSQGRLAVSLVNNVDHDLTVTYLETLPWLIQPYLHTLTPIEAIFNISYIPSLPHSRPSTLQMDVHVPAQSTVCVEMVADKSFLRYTEHPPDAQRGVDLPPGVAYAGGKRYYTNSLLVDPATPDFSMPYNVIIFTCSLVAFLFGSIFNLLTRSFVVVDLSKTETS